MRHLDSVVLTCDIEMYGLVKGNGGAVVHVYKDGTAFEVEFIAADGKTIAVLTLGKIDIRPISGNEILHVRELQAA